MVLSSLFIGFAVFLVIALWLGQSLWIYLDSRERKNSYAVLWALLALFSFPIPLLVYLIVSRGNRVKCKICGAVMEKGLTICTNCGSTLGKKCNNCGSFMEKHWNYCPNCKSKYEDNSGREN